MHDGCAGVFLPHNHAWRWSASMLFTPGGRMTAESTGTGPQPTRLLVRHAADAPERESRGDLRVRQIFQAESAGFESSLSFVLWNRIPAGGANELHVHEDIEKVYYFLAGEGEVACGPWTRNVSGGDFLFFPAAIPHMVRHIGSRDLEFVVCAARTLGLADLKIVHSTARALDVLDQQAAQRATAPRNNPWALFALNAIAGNKDLQNLLGAL